MDLTDSERQRLIPTENSPRPTRRTQTTNHKPSAPTPTLPCPFTIGGKKCQPLVNHSQLKSHLSLLHAFYDLRERAERTEFPQVASTPEESLPSRRWSFFVAYAVERFQNWCSNLRLKTTSTLPIPPADVLMVWHSYRLNPGWYVEDVARLPEMAHFSLKANTLFESPLIECPAPCPENPFQSDVNQWEVVTGMPFDAFEGIKHWLQRQLPCPYCQTTTTAELLKEDGTGHLQNNFSAQCSTCNREYNREALGVAKFLRDTLRKDSTAWSFLAGTLHTPSNPFDDQRAMKIKSAIFSAPALASDRKMTQRERVSHIGNTYKWKMSAVASAIGERLYYVGGRSTLKRILSAYVDDRPFSIDLVGAVLRQASFVEKMHKLGWTDPGSFCSSGDEIVLHHAVARYHAFLDLMSSAPTSFFVPTLDIDLAWHTHQLHAGRYGEETRQYVGRFVDHDDKVEKETLVDHFDLTCKAWKSRFGLPYSVCGCRVPGTTLSGKLSNRISQLLTRDKAKNDEAQSRLILPNRRNSVAGTHPSDHNGVDVPNRQFPSATGHKRRNNERHQPRSQHSDPFWGSHFLYPIPTDCTSLCSATGSVLHAGCVTRTGGAPFLVVGGTSFTLDTCAGKGEAGCGGGCGGG